MQVNPKVALVAEGRQGSGCAFHPAIKHRQEGVRFAAARFSGPLDHKCVVSLEVKVHGDARQVLQTVGVAQRHGQRDHLAWMQPRWRSHRPRGRGIVAHRRRAVLIHLNHGHGRGSIPYVAQDVPCLIGNVVPKRVPTSERRTGGVKGKPVGALEVREALGYGQINGDGLAKVDQAVSIQVVHP